jgi:hypothetical protein
MRSAAERLGSRCSVAADILGLCSGETSAASSCRTREHAHALNALCLSITQHSPLRGKARVAAEGKATTRALEGRSLLPRRLRGAAHPLILSHKPTKNAARSQIKPGCPHRQDPSLTDPQGSGRQPVDATCPTSARRPQAIRKGFDGPAFELNADPLRPLLQLSVPIPVASLRIKGICRTTAAIAIIGAIPTRAWH